MYMSANMYSGLTALLDVNTDLQKYQTQAITGKKINQASDGLAAYLTAQGFDNRSTRLQSLNDGLTGVLSSVSAAKSGLDQVKKTLSDLRNTLKSASETQGLQAAQGVQQVADSDPNNTQFNFQFQARFGKNQLGGFNNAQNITAETALVQSNASGVEPAANQSQVFIGNQAMREGMTIKLSAGGKDWTFKVGVTGTDGVSPNAVDDNANSTTTVYTVGQLLTSMRDKLSVDTSMTANNSVGTVLATYSGPSFGKDAYGNSDLTKPLGVSIAVDYAAMGATPANGFGAHETYDVNGNAGYMNANAMFNMVRAANNNKVTYIEDQKSMSIGGAAVTYTAPGGNRFTFDKNNAANANYNNAQSARFVGVQHNFKAAVEAKAADPTRANAAKAYRQAMLSINNFVSDATTSGINLLYGNTLKATMNEDGLSQSFQITFAGSNTGMSFTALGMGLVDGSGNAVDTAANFATNNDGLPGLMTAIDKIDNALNLTDSGLAQVGTFQSVVKDRKDFNLSIIKLLNQANVDLTGADATEVAARTSALQVQQGFAQSILSSTKQAEQSLLQLLR